MGVMYEKTKKILISWNQIKIIIIRWSHYIFQYRSDCIIIIMSRGSKVIFATPFIEWIYLAQYSKYEDFNFQAILLSNDKILHSSTAWTTEGSKIIVWSSKCQKLKSVIFSYFTHFKIAIVSRGVRPPLSKTPPPLSTNPPPFKMTQIFAPPPFYTLSIFVEIFRAARCPTSTHNVGR